MDHLYCHTNDNSSSNNYIRANSGHTADMVAVLKEIKQLKAMLLLHLDLIQEQSDQLMSKDKMMGILKKENELLRVRLERYDRRYATTPVLTTTTTQASSSILSTTTTAPVQTNNKNNIILQQQQNNIKKDLIRGGDDTIINNTSDLPEIKAKCDILKKFSTKLLNNCSMKLTTLSETIESKYKICDFDDQQDHRLVKSIAATGITTTTTATTKLPTTIIQSTVPPPSSSSPPPLIMTSTGQPQMIDTKAGILTTSQGNEGNSIIGERDGKFITKIILQRIQAANKDICDDKMIIKSEEYETDVTDIIDFVANMDTVPASPIRINKDALVKKSPITTITATTHPDTTAVDVSDFLVDSVVEKKVEKPIADTKRAAERVRVGRKVDHRRRRHRDAKLAQLGITVRKRRRGRLTAAERRIERERLIAARAANSSTQNDADGTNHTGSNLEQQQQQENMAESMIKRGIPGAIGSGISNIRRQVKPMTTTQMYLSREWQMDEIEAEVNKQIADMGGDERHHTESEDVNLEIPRWTVKESPGLYSIEGTEDLSPDIFARRHARLEHDEKKRKKWDVQRIREQRTIERLKRRHCKDELLENYKDPEDMNTFFPTAESIRYIMVTDELPVQAFGEAIPSIHFSEFGLPWIHNRTPTTAVTSVPALSLLSFTSTTPIVTHPPPPPPPPPPLHQASTSPSTASAVYNSRTYDSRHQQQKHTSIVFAKKKLVRRHHTLTTASSLATTPTRGRSGKRSIYQR